jgi:hypothetical protein
VRTLRGHSHPNRAHGSATSARADARPVATRSPRPGHAPVPAQRGPEWSGAILQRTGGAHGGPSAGSRPVHANFAVPGRGSPLGAAGHLSVRDAREGPSGRGSGRPERAQGWRAPRATRGWGPAARHFALGAGAVRKPCMLGKPRPPGPRLRAHARTHSPVAGAGRPARRPRPRRAAARRCRCCSRRCCWPPRPAPVRRTPAPSPHSVAQAVVSAPRARAVPPALRLR